MKKLFAYTYLIASAAFFTGCNDFESVFSEDADTRVKKAISQYRTTLTTAPYGWKAMLVTGTGGGYSFYFQFKENGSVTMVADFDAATSANSMEGTFVMKALQRPTLSFDTYSYIHILSDPDADVNGGTFGEGLDSDFEFAFERTTDDSVVLTGIQRDTPIAFVKATEADRLRFLGGDLNASIQNAVGYFTGNSYQSLQRDSQLITLGANTTTKVFSLFYTDQSFQIQQISLPFSFSLDGILLNRQVTAADLTFQELLWDGTTSSCYILKDNEKIYIQNSASPVLFSNASPPLTQALGTNYSKMFIDTETIQDHSATFKALYSQVSDNLESVYGVTLQEIEVSISQSKEVTMTYVLYDGSNTYEGSYYYDMNVVSGVMSLTRTDVNGIGDVIVDEVAPLLSYFEGNSFTLDYVPNANIGRLLAYARPQAAPGDHFYGYLIEREAED